MQLMGGRYAKNVYFNRIIIYMVLCSEFIVFGFGTSDVKSWVMHLLPDFKIHIMILEDRSKHAYNNK